MAELTDVIEGTATDLPPTEKKEEALNAVIVVKTKKDDGAIQTDVLTQGDIEATEVQTLLELAVGRWRQHIGLDK